MNFGSTFGLFPGQGSQVVGMGKDICEASAAAKAVFQSADEALGFSLSTLCFEGPIEELTLTFNAQPAILTTSIALLRALEEKTGSSVEFACAAGHSLGEYSAYVSAGALSFEDAVQLVHKRGKYMQEAVPSGEGAMVAVLGMDVKELAGAVEQAASESSEIVSVANDNAPGQIVVAGSKGGVDHLKKILEGKKLRDLNVSAPFHCALMEPARQALEADLKATSFSEAKFPVINNYTARAVTTPEAICQGLIDQVCGQVRWVESVLFARESINPESGLEIGAGKVLAGLFKRIEKTFPVTSLNSAESLEAL